METPTLIAYAAAAAIVMRLAAELALSWLNERHVRAHAAAVPEPFRGMIDEPTYAKSVAYTLARGRFGRVADSCQALVLLAVLYSGVLPAGLAWFGAHLGSSSWAVAAFLFAAGAGMSLPTLPLEWYADFRIERRFGFSTITPRTWWTDRVKGFLLSAALGYPLIALVLKIVEWAGARWWILAWATIVCFQLVMTVLAPVLILPLFNRFTPLPEGGLRARLLALAARTRFRARDIQVMDGSRRSHHSNAFFTGLGRFRKIVLFDTLMRQLTDGVKPQQDRARRTLGSGVILLALAGGFVIGAFALEDFTGAVEGGMMVPAAILGALGTAFMLLAIVDYASKKKDQ